MFVALSDRCNESEFELTPGETRKAAGFLVSLSKEVREVAVVEKESQKIESKAVGSEDVEIDIVDVEAFKKEILEAVHNQIVLPVTGKLY